MFLLVTRSFHPFQIRRRLIFELIFEQNLCVWDIPNYPTGLAISFVFASIQTPQQLHPLTMSSLKKCVFRTLWEFAISLGLVILCELVNVETERRNFLALEACLQMAIKRS